MTRRLRNTLYMGSIVGLIAFLVIGLLPRDSAPETSSERSHRIASELRCPFCNGESIADAQSSIAADLRDLIDEQVASGMTDDQIFDYYVGLYTDRVLLSPPLLGWGLALWLLPLLMLVGGAIALARRKRSAVASHGVIATQGALEDARRVVAADLAELDVQEAVGEVDAAHAASLRAAYETEGMALASAVVFEPAPSERSRARTATGAGILILGAIALTVAVVVTVRDRAPGELITGGIADRSEGRDLSDVTNEEMEAVIAANPDVLPMRLALAGRYFDAGDFSAAVGHYMEVLRREQNPEALANVGWMTYLSGDVVTGESFVERSLEISSELPQSYWYIANIRFWGLEDAAGAVTPLETLLAFDSIPDEVRQLADELLAEVRAAL